jgi:hypothetical protein
MKNKQTAMFVILAISIATAICGTTAMSLSMPAFANSDHDGQKCKKNEDNNCNRNVDKQRIKQNIECDSEIENKDSDKNDNFISQECISPAASVDEAVLVNSSIFDVTAD